MRKNRARSNNCFQEEEKVRPVIHFDMDKSECQNFVTCDGFSISHIKFEMCNGQFYPAISVTFQIEIKKKDIIQIQSQKQK